MRADPCFWAGKRVCVTGGTGFLGWHLVLQLLPLGARVRVFGLRPRSPRLRELLQAVDCVYGDVRDPRLAAEALADCDIIFHTAGTIAMWGPAIQAMHDIHVNGTRTVLHAQPAFARLVHTSSVVAVGATRDRMLLDEDSPFQPAHLQVDYVHAKRAAEAIALDAADRGQHVVVVNPGYLIGPEDHEGSAVGQFCLRCWRNKIQLLPGGGLSVVDVRDVALGHLLAAQHGSAGKRYILAGENVTYAQLLERLFAVCQPPARPRFVIPNWIFMVIACLAEVRGRWRHKEPYPSRQQVRLSGHSWCYSSARACHELGYQTRPLEETLYDMHAWYCREGLLPAPLGHLADPASRKAA